MLRKKCGFLPPVRESAANGAKAAAKCERGRNESIVISKREKLQYLYVFVTDLLSLFVSIALSWLLVDSLLGKMAHYDRGDLAVALSLLVAAYLMSFLVFDQKENITTRTQMRELKIAIKFNLLLALINSAGLALTKAALLQSRYFLVAVPCVNILVMTLLHGGLKYLLTHTRRLNGMESLVGVVTTREHAEALLADIRKDWSQRVTGIALLEIPHEEVGGEVSGVRIEANYTDFMDWLRQAALDEVYIDIPMDSGDSFVPYLDEMESMGLTVHFRLPLLDRIEEACCDETSTARLSRSLDRCAGGNVVTMGTVEIKLRDQACKRVLDIVGSLVGCIISIPIIAIVAIPLKLESPGPLVFKQRRVGRNGRVFYIHKLRSMYIDAEERKKELMAKNEMNGLMFKMQDDPRITKVGKFIRKTSIDELPQFFDVLRGDMSLVGTRPPTLDEYKQYESHHKRRLSMKPGITGLWQVSGRSNIENFEDVVKLDVKYIDNWSLWQDIKILLKTVWVVLAGRGAE